MQAKILKTKRQIQRLRLERRSVDRYSGLVVQYADTQECNSILYDRFQEAKNAGTLENTSIPTSSLQAQLASVPFGSLNGSNAMHHSSHQSHQSHQPSSSFHTSLSQGYHPSQFIHHPGLMHDSNDTLMMNSLQHHDIRGVDPHMSMSL